MPWSATLISVAKSATKNQETLIVPLVRFVNSDTGEVVERTLQADDITQERLEIHAQRVIESLEKRDTAFPTLTIGPITLPRDKGIDINKRVDVMP